MRLNKSFLQLVFCMSAVALTSSLSAQVFMKNLGTTRFELSVEMTPTSDGNYVTVGPVRRGPNMPPGFDLYLNKVTPTGVLIWSRQIVEIDPAGLGNTFPQSVTETFDPSGAPTGFAVTGGYFNGRAQQHPIFIVTTNVNGLPISYNTYGGFVGSPNLPIVGGFGAQIIQTPNGELAVCGSVQLADRVGRVPFILVARRDLSLRFLRLYHDMRFFNQNENLFGFDMKGHFADIEMIRTSTDDGSTDGGGTIDGGVVVDGGIDLGGGVVVDGGGVVDGGIDLGGIDTGTNDPNDNGGGVNKQEGFVVVGTTSKVNDWYSEIIVMRTDMNGNPVAVGLYGPTQIPSRGTALTVASSGDLEVAGLVLHSGGAPSTIVLNIDSATLMQLDSDEYYGFVTLGDIRELSNGDFLLSGREWSSNNRDAALLRIQPDGSIVFGLGYGGRHVELFTDAHEMPNGDLYASGATTTWCSGPVDEYLVRTLADGSVAGCPVTPLNIDHAEPTELERFTKTRLLDLREVVEHTKRQLPPRTVVRLICPRIIVKPDIPWDWFIRADFDRNLKVDINDSVRTLQHLFADGEASVPKEAADANGDGETDLADVIYSLLFLYGGGSQPSGPFKEPGPDPSNIEGNVFTLEDLEQQLSEPLAPEDLHSVELPTLRPIDCHVRDCPKR